MAAENLGISLDKYEDDDLFSIIVRYGLFIGGIFQVVCMASAVLMTGNEGVAEGEDTNDSRSINDSTPASTSRRFHKIRKLEKKKRR